MKATLPFVFVAIVLLTVEARAQVFSRPVACDSCIGNWFYFDNDATGSWQDWSCGDSSYDGHRGSDFSLSGGISAIATGYDVVAAADGEVIRAEDGHYDQCQSCYDPGCGTSYGYGFGNHVIIDHGDYDAVYAHLRTGSVRVGVGDPVECGQTVGQIGSSGCSSGAHLHFEVRPSGGDYTTAIDPFEGGCSPTSPSLWIDQGSYRGLPATECDWTPPPTCPDGTTEIWTCTDSGTARRRCVDGNDETEPCEYGCVSSPAGTDDQCAGPPDPEDDLDGDGYGVGVDCDDDDGSRFPGAPEICGDGIDQNCDGEDVECPGDDGGDPWTDASPDGSIDAPVVPLSGRCDCRAARPQRSDGSGRALISFIVELVRLGSRS